MLRTVAERERGLIQAGRPYAYGLVLGGQAGCGNVLRCVLVELDRTLALAGYADLVSLRASRDAVTTVI